MNVKLEIERAKEEADDYGKACLDSAYKAYKSLEEDGHSGLSFSITRTILEKLLYEIPLSPITEEDFENVEQKYIDLWKLNDKKITCRVQCPRRTSLFQTKFEDGHAEYSDNERVALIDENGLAWINGVASRVIDKLHPITMPYTPTKNPYKVFGYSFMHDPKTCETWIEKGSFTFMYLESYQEPSGETHRLDMLFEEADDEMVEVTDETRKRKIVANSKACVEQSKEEHKKYGGEIE